MLSFNEIIFLGAVLLLASLIIIFIPASYANAILEIIGLVWIFFAIVEWLLEKYFGLDPQESRMAIIEFCGRVFHFLFVMVVFLFVMVVLFGWFLPNLPGWTGSCVGSCIGDYQTAKQEALEEAKKKDEQPKQKEQKP